MFCSAKYKISCFGRFTVLIWEAKYAELLADINIVASPQEEGRDAPIRVFNYVMTHRGQWIY
jgi:hypothetical protein